VWRAERRPRHERPAGVDEPGDGLDAGDLERRVQLERRQHTRKPAREHRLAGSRGTREEQVVAPRGGDLERTARPLLSADIREIELRRLRRMPVGGDVGLGLNPVAEVHRRLGQVAQRNRLHAGEGGLRRRSCRADEPRQTRLPRRLGRGQHAADRTQPPVEGELADRCVAAQAFRRDLARGGEEGEGDRQVEARALLPQRRGRQVDGDPPLHGPLELGGGNPAAHAVLRLLAGAVGEADDRKAGDPALEVRLDLDPARLEADDGVRDRAREHASRLGRRTARMCAGSAPKPFFFDSLFRDLLGGCSNAATFCVCCPAELVIRNGV
jgi:hypothetical protein